MAISSSGRFERSLLYSFSDVVLLWCDIDDESMSSFDERGGK